MHISLGINYQLHLIEKTNCSKCSEFKTNKQTNKKLHIFLVLSFESRKFKVDSLCIIYEVPLLFFYALIQTEAVKYPKYLLE